jgi:hypothetical protein
MKKNKEIDYNFTKEILGKDCIHRGSNIIAEKTGH